MKILRYLGLAALLASSVFAGQSELVGRWTAKDGKEMTAFTADGRVRSSAGGIAVMGKFECKANILILKFDGDGAPPKIERKFQVIGDILRLEDINGHEVIEFHREVKRKA